MNKPKKKFEYGLPKVGDQLYLEPKGQRAMPRSVFLPRSGFYRLICCCGYYSLVSEDTWKAAYRFNDIASLIESCLKDSRIFKVEQ